MEKMQNSGHSNLDVFSTIDMNSFGNFKAEGEPEETDEEVEKEVKEKVPYLGEAEIPPPKIEDL